MTIRTTINGSFENIPNIGSKITRLISQFESDGKIISQNNRNIIKVFTFNEIGENIVIKQYRNNGILQKILSCFKVSKAYRAFYNGLLLSKRGILTPTPIAFTEERKNGYLKASYYVCLYTKDNTIMPLIERQQPDKTAIKAFAQLLANLHENGIVHHDLNLSNVLYHTGREGVVLSVIDINRLSYRTDEKPVTKENKYSDDLMRFTGRLDIFISIAYEYAKLRKIDIEPFVRRMTLKKINHDMNWTRKKKFHKLFKS